MLQNVSEPTALHDDRRIDLEVRRGVASNRFCSYGFQPVVEKDENSKESRRLDLYK